MDHVPAASALAERHWLGPMTKDATRQGQSVGVESDNDAQDGAWRLLMEATQGGDRGAYRTLLSQLTPYLYRILRSRLSSASEVDDVVQETLLSLHLARHTYDPKRPFKPWLKAIALRRLVDSFRRRGQQMAHEAHADLTDVTIPGLAANSDIEAPLVARDMQRALDQLPARQRELLVLVKLRGAPLADAARAVGASVGNAKVMIHRALKTLRRIIDEQSGD